MEAQTFVPQLILQLLSERSPEFGARLKQRLDALLARKGLGRFDQRAYGYQKFSSFLSSALGDKVLIEQPSGAGDMRIILRKTSQGTSTFASPSQFPEHAAVIRSEVWQAFTNPDSKRKRFFDKETKSIRHFVIEEPLFGATAHEPDANRIEIQRISPETQKAWMRSFLDSLRMPADEITPLEALITQNYTSALNAAFTRALGDNSSSWRSFRTHRVIMTIRAWASSNGVDFNDLCVQRDSIQAGARKTDDETQFTPRQRAVKLLDLLTDDDIAQLVIPTLLSSILIKSRL